MNQATSTFSPPLSDLTLDGKPYVWTACSNEWNTVSAWLLVLELEYTIILENPSIPPCITNLHTYIKLRILRVLMYKPLLHQKPHIFLIF